MPNLHFEENSGILHCDKVKYIIRCNIKYINHTRTLVLYIYERENLLENKQGQPILVLYYTETGLIDCLHAIGIKDGIGPETYSIISSNSSLLVSRVGLEEKDIPDVTEPLYDQVFIYRNDNTDQTFWVIDKKGKRELIEIEKKTDKKESPQN